MELSGEHKISAPRKVVWDALHDPDILKACIKGCERMEKVSDHALSATVQAKVGPVKAKFDADVTIVDPVAPERYTLVGEGKGGVAGFAKGSADVALEEDGRDTILRYDARATVGGKLAQLGSRLVDTTARKYAADFFEAFSEKVGTAAAAPDAVDAAPPVAPAPEPTGRVEPTPRPELTAARIDEGLTETEIAARARPVDSAHGEDGVEEKLEVAAGRNAWGGAFMWGLFAFAVVILVLIALQ
ncbi:carbon monoxide dehydrogenase subunit G [Acuticoccus sp. MNP-M23]|uniref:CoxG family protein n=1 Tax=Acuticoccus sp. MNP-M23 TaxID=3072793 RepID=UPI0028156158|nr:carbon monoxide dehydrogenase subunit G [Acuticoccus sp. MNP-M23]WMS44822.1 carbon monoxide dehydrogenase subunit G [Acuticoccus sp. MNP-M23]